MPRPLAFINKDEIQKVLAYDPETGYFSRLTSDSRGRFPAGFAYKPKTWDQYVIIKVNGRNYAAHRLAWVLMTGEQPEIVDHINGLRHDNRFVNLRSGTYSDNGRNKKKHRQEDGTYVPHPDADFY